MVASKVQSDQTKGLKIKDFPSTVSRYPTLENIRKNVKSCVDGHQYPKNYCEKKRGRS